MTTAHVYEIFIKATPERVWNALIDPEHTRRYFHATSFESTFEPGAPYTCVMADGAPAVDGVIEVFEPPTRLVMTWHVLYDAALADESPGRVEWHLTPANDDGTATRVRLRHGDLGASPLTWSHVRIGWVEIVDGLKTLLETGEPLGGVTWEEDDGDAASITSGWHRAEAAAANNATWALLDRDELDERARDELLEHAYASAYHWAKVVDATPAHAARAHWLLSRCHVVLGHGELALHHAERSAGIVADADLGDFDLGYAHEARARALASLGRTDEAAAARRAAESTPINDPEDRSIFDADLAAEPWFGVATPV